MAIETSILNARVLSAQLQASIGAVDIPEAIVNDLLGLNVFAGQQMYDSVGGGIVEVVSAGVQTVNPNPTGA